MYIIEGRNVNECWQEAKVFLTERHIVRPSRYGEVWEAECPIATIYNKPCERVLFDPQRDANPFFHFFEGLWMLAGRKDVPWLAQFNKRMTEFSDDGGKTQRGAYGYRWRDHFATVEDSVVMDQLPAIIHMLKNNPDERRTVLQMYDPSCDLNRPKLKDIPCNLCCLFKVRGGKLEMTVCNRSNDIVWGLYGANAVHMSMLLEYVASMAGYPVGRMFTLSDSFHAYTAFWEKYVPNLNGFSDLYEIGGCYPYPMVEHPPSWDEELHRFLRQTEEPDLEEPVYGNAFFPEVAQPLYNAWSLWKQKDPAAYNTIIQSLDYCKATDWKAAATMWMLRRISKKKEQ